MASDSHSPEIKKTLLGKDEEKTSPIFPRKVSQETEALDKWQIGKRSNTFHLKCLVLPFNEDFIILIIKIVYV